MTAFRYSAALASGKTEEGVVDADSARLARALLRERGLTPLSIDAIGGELGDGSKAKIRRRRVLPAQERAIMTRQLASLVSAGLPISQALQTLQSQAERPAVRDLYAAIRGDVGSGQSLAAAYAKHPRDFPELDRALIAAGEQSGHLDEVLSKLADHIERATQLANKVRLAFAYPVIVTLIALGVVTGLLTYVVPQIVGVFTQTHQKLPLLTRLLIGSSVLLRQWGWLMVIVLIALFLSVRAALQVRANRLAFDMRLLHLPIAGPLVRLSNLARFADTLAILVGAGVPILRALQAARDTIKNQVLVAEVDAAIDRVREGAPLSRALNRPGERRGHFPPVLINLIASGEATGRLPSMLERAARQEADEFERRTLMLTTLLEPLLVLAMGGVVLVIVLAILLPIIELNQIIR
jgi:general secretion pathway protein F